MSTVTAVVSIFNGSRFIEDSIEYLRQQEYAGTEILFVVDSKTTDDTLEKIERFGKGLEHRVIVQKDAQGLAGSRNIGLDEAKGKYIWFLDVDDRPYPDFLSIMVRSIEENDADVAICNYIRSSEKDIKEHEGRYKVEVLNRDRLIKRLVTGKVSVTTWSKVFRTDIMRKNDLRFFPGYAEDIGHTYRALAVCNKAVYCSKPLYVYHQNPWSLSSLLGNKKGYEEIREYRELIETFDDADLKKRVDRRSAVMMMRSAVRLDRDAYCEYIKSEEFRSIGKRFLRAPPSLEYICVRISPKVYYAGMHFYLRRFYYRELRCYNRI